MSFRVTQTNTWSQRWWADLSPTAAHIYHWVYSNQRTDGACSSGLYHALLTDIMSGAHIRDQKIFDVAFKELTDSGIVVYDYDNALLLDTRFVTDQLVNANQLKGALAYLGSLDPFPIVMMATKIVRGAFERLMERSRGNPSDTLPPEPLRNPPREHRKGKNRIGEERIGKKKKTLPEIPPSSYDAQIDALMTGFDKEEKELISQFLDLAASERKTGKISTSVRMRFVNELHQLKHDYPAEFKTGLTETVDRGIPNANYAKAVMRGMGKRRQGTLKLWSAQKKRAEYAANMIARERADREHEKNLEDRKRRERARREEAGYGPDREGATGGGVPRDGRGNRAEGNRGTGQNSRCPQVPAAQGGGRTMDDGQGCTPKVTEVSLSDYLPPESPGAVHADGGSSGDGDGGRGALVQASGTGSGGRS